MKSDIFLYLGSFIQINSFVDIIFNKINTQVRIVECKFKISFFQIFFSRFAIQVQTFQLERQVIGLVYFIRYDQNALKMSLSQGQTPEYSKLEFLTLNKACKRLTSDNIFGDFPINSIRNIREN